MIDLDRLRASTACSGVCQQLRFDAAIHGTKEVGSRIDALRHRQDTMILENHGFFVAKCFSNTSTFLMCKHDAPKVVVLCMIVVEAAGVLVDRLQLATECRESLRRQAVAMYCGDDIRSSLVDCSMDSEACGIDGVHVAFGLHNALLIDETEVFRPHVFEGLTERVDPKMVRFDGVADGDMTSRSLVIVAIQTKPPNASRSVKLPKGALVERVTEGRDADLFDCVDLVARDGMRSIREAVEWPVAGGLPELARSLVSRKLIDWLAHGFDSGRCHDCSGGRAESRSRPRIWQASSPPPAR